MMVKIEDRIVEMSQADQKYLKLEIFQAKQRCFKLEGRIMEMSQVEQQQQQKTMNKNDFKL